MLEFDVGVGSYDAISMLMFVMIILVEEHPSPLVYTCFFPLNSPVSAPSQPLILKHKVLSRKIKRKQEKCLPLHQA